MAEGGNISHPGQGNPDTLDLVSKSQLQEQLERLKAKKTELLNEIDEVKHLISLTGTSYNRMESISSLPNELLSLIFLESMESAASSKSFIRGRSVEIMISHVCRAWREIALSLPPLWSKIRCKTSAKLRISHANSIKRLRIYLTRSNPSPIDVWLDLEKNFGIFGEQIFGSLLQHAHRWRIFWVYCKGLDLALHLYAPLKYLRAPLLESFSIRLPPSDRGHRAVIALQGLFIVNLFEQYTPLIFSPQGAPHLSSVYLAGAAVHFFRPPISARMTTVILDKRSGNFYMSAKQLKGLLQLPLLSCLSLDGQVTEFSQLLASCGPMKAERLQHLRFTNGPADSFCQLVVALATPNLETLDLRGIEPSQSFPQSPARLPRLRCLTFRGFHHIIETPFRTFIASLCSSVRQIDFHLTFANNVQTILFDDDSVGTSGWPNLTTITSFALSAADTKALHSYVSLRAHGERPIRTMRLGIIRPEQQRLWGSLNIDVQLCAENNEWPPETIFGYDKEVFNAFL